ncbi:amidohydrolase [Flavobacteriales bacterium]|nr:amidohydrolase [Flavobacteriales bacterium]
MESSLRVTLLQTSLHWESPQKNRLHFDSLFETFDQTDLIILPELFSTAFSVSADSEKMDGLTIKWLKQKSIQLNAVIVGSLIIEENNKRFNRLVCVYPDGNLFHYDKRHLFSLMDEQKHFYSGNSRLIIDVKGWKICPLICYDLRFPVFSRNQEDYDVLVYVANWPTSRISQWQKLLAARAIENQSYVVAVNRIGQDVNQVQFNGFSCVLDFKGDYLANLKNERACCSIELDKFKLQSYRAKFPFLADKDAFTII